ncbi:30S ribosome-binding factor RbfA [Chloroflexota bacterium]
MTRRRERVNELIRKEVSELLRREVKDPRLKGFITITEVSVSPDLRHAKVFFSVMGTEEEWRQTLDGLVAASGFMRRQLGDRLSLRYTPELAFERDQSIERGSHLLELMKEVPSNETLDEAS